MNSSLATAWLLLLIGCGTPNYIVRLDTGEGMPRTVKPHVPTRPVALDTGEFKAFMRGSVREGRPPLRPREAARKLFEMGARTGFFEFNSRTHRLSAADDPNTSREETAGREDALTRDYQRWCERTGRSGDCLHLLDEGPQLGGDSRYTLAMALAKEVVLDELLEMFKDMVNPHAMVSTVLWTCTTYLVLLTVPEPVSKGLAAVMTATLIAYVGVDTFWGLLVGFKQLVLESDRATTFQQLREAGERYGRRMGRDAARAFAMITTVAVGNTAAGFAAKVPGLPGYPTAVLNADAQAGFRLGAVAEVQSVALPAVGSMTMVLTSGAVMAMSMEDGTGGQGPAGEVRPPATRHHARQVDQRTVTKNVNTVLEPRVDVKADVEAIKSGRATIGCTSGGETSYTVNGRTYGAHSNGTLYPVEGDGIHVLDRGSFRALGVYNRFGNTSRSAEILDEMGINASQRAGALSVWRTYQEM